MKSFISTCFFASLLIACVPPTYMNYANTSKASGYDVQGKSDSAIYYYTQAIKQEQRNSDLYQKRALVYNKMNLFTEAMSDINKAISMSGRNWNYYYSRAIILEKQGKYEMAIPDYSAYIAHTDKKVLDLFMGYWGRGKCYYYLKNNMSLSIADFSQSILLKPTDLNLLTWRATAYYDSKNFAAAAKDYELYMAGNPKDLKQLFYLGSSYTFNGDKEKAISVFNKMADYDPSLKAFFPVGTELDFFNTELRKQKVKNALEEANMNLKDAEGGLSKSLVDISLSTAFEKLQTAWGYALGSDQENMRLSDSTMRLIVSTYPKLKEKPLIPEFVRKFTVQAGSYVEEKNYSMAIDFYLRALNTCPFYPLARFNLAMLFASVQDFNRAILHMNLYMKLVPDAKDIRAAQDKIYEWELKVKS